MTQNTSAAVMAQRKTGKAKKNAKPEDMERDDFPTPPWATRALIEHVILPLMGRGGIGVNLRRAELREQTAWEPACGRGFMSEALSEYFGTVWSSDIQNYGYPGTHDVGSSFQHTKWRSGTDWIITNPPFNQAEAFIKKALPIADRGVAMLVRTAFLESTGRYDSIFQDNAPTVIAFFTERVPMVKGKCDPKASTATAYSWLVWTAAPPQPPVWIPPCRKQLEREEDYIEPRLRRARA